jgi:hypothetical protein
MSFRKVAIIAKCSHGSISAEKKDMLREEAEQQERLKAQMQLLPPSGDDASLRDVTGDQATSPN